MGKEKITLIFWFLLISIMLIILIIAAPSFHTSGTVSNLTEDQSPVFTYNFTANVTNAGNETLIFEAVNITVSPDLGLGSTFSNYYWISLNSSTGVITINSTRNNETGYFNISIFVRNSGGDGESRTFYFNVTAINDAPAFANLINKTFNVSEVFTYIVNITDEENNIPFVINISFLNCSVAQWSTRNCSNSSGRELFNSSYYSLNSTSGVLNISFTPQKNDVGSYTINFSVTDNSSLGNITTSQIVNFTVLNMNSAPYFRYVCDNERNATEDSEFTCWINASDTDEIYNLTFSSNYSWFTFYNNSAIVTSLAVSCNSSTNYNASAMVNFTLSDAHVGNWSINISVIDIGSGFNAPKTNSSVFWFFINNTEDSVSLDVINNRTINENTTFYVNATDNDLLVTQKNIKNEVLTFASNTSWVNISSYSSSGNYTTAKIQIDYNTALSFGAGNYTIKVNVTDTTGNFANRNFTIMISNNTKVNWNSGMNDTFVIYENNLTYLNFSQNVTDPEGDNITFSFTNDSAFPSFSINSTTGVINFTPVDGDVGYHNITINASDGKLDSLKSFNFTVYNVNDAPYIESPILQADVINASVDSNSNINCTEDNVTIITLWLRDDDFKIPSNQKSFYNESLNVSLNISGINISLFNFVIDSSFPTSGNNRSKYTATFTPKKSDIGSYNITINVTDRNNASVILQFNLTVLSINHAPVLMNLTNQTSSVNRTFYYRINATDIEDGNSSVSGGNANFTFKYNFTSGSNFLNTTTFNSTTGEINITFNSTHGGKYHLNITVNDSSGAEDSGDFWIYVYDAPNVTFPVSNYEFNLAENTTLNLTFRANHSVADNLTYEFYIRNSNGSNVLKYNISYYGNNTNLTWQFTPNFTEETYGIKNLTLIVLSPTYLDLNYSAVWNITINHTNSPVAFSGHMGDSQADYNNVITINLSNYFSDIDYSDSYYNQTINFSASSNSTPSYITKSFLNWTLILSSSIAVRELLNITAIDSNGTNVTSNIFEVQFTTPTTTTVPTSGGGGDSPIPVAFKIITPKEISAYAYQKIEIPFNLQNKGSKSFKEINISVAAFKDGNLENKVRVSIDKNYFESLEKGKTENLTLTVFFETNKTGDYEILVNATSKSPKYTDWAKIYIDLQSVNESEIRELLIFTEEFIAENPECIEITEIVNEARNYFKKGDIVNAKERAEQAISKCKEAISQPGLASLKLKSPLTTNEYLIIATLSSMIIGISYYFIKRRRFKKMIFSGEITPSNKNNLNIKK
ncbi:MAG: hypothetical protein Q8N63_07830 [Nanoarchaeota archaeon]|nr:hypothetical protein [Nanoarchaeota archaeon]